MVAAALGGVVLIVALLALHRPLASVPAARTAVPAAAPRRGRARRGARATRPGAAGAAVRVATGPSATHTARRRPSPKEPGGGGHAKPCALLLIAVVLIGLGASRARARRARVMQRVLITPGRSSEASPAQVAGLIEALMRITREHGLVRLTRGSPPVATLELISGPHPGGASEQRIGIAVPRADGTLGALRGALASRYPDAEVTPVGEEAGEALRAWLREVVRLKKVRSFARALDRPLERSLASPEPYTEPAIDAVLAVMAEVGERVLVQITISPVPDLFQRGARAVSVRRPAPAGKTRPADPARQREERASTDAVVFRPLAFCDIRVGAETYRAARHVAGAIEGQALGGENELRQHRPILRRPIYIGRLARAESNPLPSWWRGAYSSLEIAALWQLPTAHAKNVAVERTSVPQLAMPPEVHRPLEERKAIATDLRGNYVGIREGDWKYGFQVSGAAGGGKTSVLARVGAVRACEPNTALVVLDPKGELAEAIAASVPAWRTVRFLDVGRPLFGLALETPERDLTVEAEIFSEAMVDVSRTEEGDSQALNASQRSFKMARGATLALESEPTFWHTARWLASDDEAAEWRAKKIAGLAGDPRWHAVWDHFARILPAQLQKSPSQAVMRLEAPYNKIQTLLGDERLNAVLHHPVTISIAETIRKREVLLVAGRVDDHPDAVVFLKFAIQVLHRAIFAQQGQPEDERARVAAIIDDAGDLFTPTIDRMMAHDRSAGLDLALGWQHGGQMTPELAEAVDALCNSRIYLRSGERDAERAVNRLNPSYEARQSGALGERRRSRVEVNQLTGLELKHGVAVLQSGERLSSSFTIRTIPWRRDPRRLAEFEARVRAEGGYEPEVIAPPAELTGRGENEDLRDVGGEEAPAREGVGKGGPAPTPAEAAGEGRPGPSPAAPTPPRVEAPPEPRPDVAAAPPPAEERGPRPPRRGRRQAEVAPLGTPTDKPLSAGYAEVELLREQAAAISWEKSSPEPAELRHKAINAEQRAILEALYELRVLSAGQIQREFLVSAGERQVRRELSLLVRRRMIRRGELGLRKARGRGKRFYVLGEEGFALLRDAGDHPASGNWRAPELNSSQHLVHDLARNEWLWAFRSLAPRQLAGWRGARTGKVEVPLIKEGRGPARPVAPRDLRENSPIDFAGEEFANLVPDLTLELVLRRPDGESVETDLLVEIEWGNNDETVRRKAIAYDGFLTGWWRAHPRYRDLGRPPIVFFVVSDPRRAARFVELLDETLTSYLLGPAETQSREQNRQGVTPEAKRLRLGRRNVFVAVGRDISQRTLRAWRVPAEPPAERVGAARNAQERRAVGKPVPRPFMLIEPRDLVDPAA